MNVDPLASSTLNSPTVPPMPSHRKILADVLARIRASLDMEENFQTTVMEIRSLLEVDRVGIFRFYPEQEWAGEFIAEALNASIPSALEMRVSDHCFSDRFAPLYQAGRINAIVDIYAQDYQPCYIELLEKFHVRANIVAPLLKGTELWGLVCIHQCDGPRDWAANDLAFIQQVADNLSVALQHDDLLKQAAQAGQAAEQKRLAQQQQRVFQAIGRIRDSLTVEKIFGQTVEEVRELLQCDRTVIYRFNPDWTGEFVAESYSSNWTSLMAQQIEDPSLKESVSECAVKLISSFDYDSYIQVTEGAIFSQSSLLRVANDIYTQNFTPCYIQTLEKYEARAYAIVGLFDDSKLWGVLAAYQNDGPRIWKSDELSIITQVGTQLWVTLQQAQYLQNLQQKTANLRKAGQRQHALLKTVDRIRQSLDIETIFENTTQEVRLLLEVDRVAIYRFYEDWSGEFVADSMADTKNMETPLISPTISAGFAKHLSKDAAGKYARHETFVPILQGEKLWGLLMAYQSHEPRFWQEEEVNLLAQVGIQLGVAIQQAELLKHSQQQAQQLQSALADLKASQVQLTQREKMASLGNLVAGIAHEINNPVNFIAGNLLHISNYSLSLLDLIKLYQSYYKTHDLTNAHSDDRLILNSDLLETIKTRSKELDIDFVAQDLPQVLASMQLGTDRIRQIVLSLRNFSRHDESALKTVNIHDGLENTLLLLQYRLKESNERPEIQVVKMYGTLPRINCYPAQLNQVFMHLLSNAIDAIDLQLKLQPQHSPQIQVKTRMTSDQTIVIEVIDSGIGIEPSIVDRVFDPFFTTKPVGKGAGLGLSVSYQIITDIHHGKLSYSHQQGYGSCFSIELPIDGLYIEH